MLLNEKNNCLECTDELMVELSAMHAFSQDDLVWTCDFIERGLSFQLEGITACCESTMQSPALVTPEEINCGKLSYDIIINRRTELFLAINGKGTMNPGKCGKCSRKIKKRFSEVEFESLGNIPVMNIQHYTKCNMKCIYCCYANDGRQVPEKYSTSIIIDIINQFIQKGKCIKNIWCTFSGGEPTLLSDCDKFIDFFYKNNLGNICLFSNALIYNHEIENRLKAGQIFLTTSIDAGTPSTFKKMRGVDSIYRVVDNLIKYRKTNTKNLWLKYIITENNISDDDLFSFVFMMVALRPDKIYIAVDFPYGDKEIPDGYAHFAAKLWYNLKKYGRFDIQYYSDVNSADPKFGKFYQKLKQELASLCERTQLTEEYILTDYVSRDEEILGNYNEETYDVKEMNTSENSLKTNIGNKFLKQIRYCLFYTIKLFIFSFFSKTYRKILFIHCSGMFDNLFYKQNNQDVVNIMPIEHYVKYGAEEGRDPNAWFSTMKYYENNPDVKMCGENAFYHYLLYGVAENRSL